METGNAGQVLGFGRLALDHFLVTDTPGHLLAMGPVALARALRVGELLDGDGLQQGGSSVANTLCAMARLGLPCAMLGAVGGGATGEKILESLRVHGVDLSGVSRQPERRSRRCWVVVDRRSGERALLPERPEPAVINPRPEICEAPLAAGARVIHQSKHSKGVLRCLRSRPPHPHRPWSSFNFGYPPRRGERADLDALLALADLVIVSEAVGEALGAVAEGRILPGARSRLGGRGLRIVTLGERGAVALGREGNLAVPALPTELRDTTGAGDAFHGGVLTWLLTWEPSGMPLDELPVDRLRPAMALGTFLASSVCRHLGARTGLLDRREIAHHVRSQGEGASKVLGDAMALEAFLRRLEA